jgi:YggT family protein
MTMEKRKKMQRQHPIFYTFFIYIAGLVEGLLLGRLLARLFLAREDNPLINVLYQVTEPLSGVLRWLDEGQPLFGASLELSTLAMAICVPVVTYGVWWWGERTSKPVSG